MMKEGLSYDTQSGAQIISLLISVAVLAVFPNVGRLHYVFCPFHAFCNGVCAFAAIDHILSCGFGYLLLNGCPYLSFRFLVNSAKIF